jgi:hypothetical protein
VTLVAPMRFFSDYEHQRMARLAPLHEIDDSIGELSRRAGES